MSGFELNFTPSLSRAHLVRDLVAIGAGSLDLSLDRMRDLLVLTDQLVSRITEDSNVTSVTARLAVEKSRLEFILEAVGATALSSPVSAMILNVLADEHWDRSTDDGMLIGFALAN